MRFEFVPDGVYDRKSSRTNEKEAAAIVKYAIIVLGVILLIWAVLRLFDSTKKTGLVLLYIIGAAVIGVLMIVSYYNVVSWFFLVIGILLIIEGILCLIPASAKK